VRLGWDSYIKNQVSILQMKTVQYSMWPDYFI